MVIDGTEVERVDETKNLVMAVSSKKESSQVVCEIKQKIAQIMQRLLDSSHTLEEVKAIEKKVVSIEPTLEAIRSSQRIESSLPSTSGSSTIPANKKIESQRRLFKTKKTKKKRK